MVSVVVGLGWVMSHEDCVCCLVYDVIVRVMLFFCGLVCVDRLKLCDLLVMIMLCEIGIFNVVVSCVSIVSCGIVRGVLRLFLVCLLSMFS